MTRATTVSDMEAHVDERQGRYYRPELDLLRLLAFALVYLHHTFPRDAPYYAAHNIPFGEVFAALANAFGFGLPLFFYLSAFLITTLLDREKSSTGAIRVIDFYTRRILRIWPLYFFGLALGIAIAGSEPVRGDRDILRMFAMYAAMCGNWFYAGGRADWTGNPFTPLWSISVEEQFYALWPLALSVTSRTAGLWLCGAVAVLACLVELCLGSRHVDTDAIIWTNSFVQFELFAAGAATAFWMRNRRTDLKVGYRLALGLCTAALWFCAVYYLRSKYIGPARSGISLAVGYLFITAGCVTAFRAIYGVKTSGPSVFLYLGKISFGLYVFHEAAITLVEHFANRLATIPDRLLPHLALNGLVALPLTIAAAALSYAVIEKPFLRLKNRFTLIASRPE